MSCANSSSINKGQIHRDNLLCSSLLIRQLDFSNNGTTTANAKNKMPITINTVINSFKKSKPLGWRLIPPLEGGISPPLRGGLIPPA